MENASYLYILTLLSLGVVTALASQQAENDVFIMSSCVIPLFTSAAGDLLVVSQQEENSIQFRPAASRGSFAGAMYGLRKVEELRRLGQEEVVSDRIVRYGPAVVEYLGGDGDEFMAMLHECELDSRDGSEIDSHSSSARALLFGKVPTLSVKRAFRKLKKVLGERYGITTNEVIESTQRQLGANYSEEALGSLSSALDALLEEEDMSEFDNLFNDSSLSELELEMSGIPEQQSLDSKSTKLTAAAAPAVKTWMEGAGYEDNGDPSRKSGEQQAFELTKGTNVSVPQYDDAAIKAAVEAALAGNERGVEDALSKPNQTVSSFQTPHYPLAESLEYSLIPRISQSLARLNPFYPTTVSSSLSNVSKPLLTGIFSPASVAAEALRSTKSVVQGGLQSAGLGSGILRNAMLGATGVGSTRWDSGVRRLTY